MSYDHMSKHDIASLARENLHWVSTLITLAKKNGAYSETLLDIAEYLSDTHYSDFDEMANEMK
ncbi:hypothetical protein LP123_05295 [Moraxella bovis]|uniref:Uncharacterized protein n=1 Tax=Moraxella bovis TaxID=476 RepID=A0AAQ2Q660_MORBO|nr:hypothetical protein [Moraxella bovis]AWY19963.1 hypothetical protein DQF64_05280 [Moraxella bovis]OOR87173.1 hypothetical protein B0182_13035 [Moraxella bovis]UYZ74491.1 hypothetical protein LP093_06775 [Moraxella bovis]UYZ74895.1 hypothetical protein LP093_08955 [Moraxella bovis]UYZ79177.1 hypothetical protein LP115_04910 [Moraxella bovis]